MILYIDEAGMGPWAGPLAVGAAISSSWIEGQFKKGDIADSKKLSESKRASAAYSIVRHVKWWGVRLVSVETIDAHGLGVARALAIQSLVEQVPYDLRSILIDGVGSRQYAQDNLFINTEYKIKGDQSIAGIAAASILAKVTRDIAMQWYDHQFPQFGFAAHKGYGTKRHIEALHRYGVSSLHRTSFAPIRAILNRSVENIV